MAEIKIKDGSVKDFELLFSLSQETLTLLIDNLKKVEPELSPQKAAQRLQETIYVDDLEAIVRLIYGVNQLKLSSDLSAEKVADDLLNALEPIGLENFDVELNKSYLLDILNIEGATSLTIMATNSTYAREKILLLSFERRKRESLIADKLSPIQKAIQESRYILDLQDNWDDEGSVGYEFSTWERATQAILRIARNAFDLFDVIIDAPEITHGPNGSIDALWDQKNYRLLVNFPNDIRIPAFFYGDDSENESVKGTFGQSEGGCNLLFYLVGTKRCSR